jgi:hypothetical protein
MQKHLLSANTQLKTANCPSVALRRKSLLEIHAAAISQLRWHFAMLYDNS